MAVSTGLGVTEAVDAGGGSTMVEDSVGMPAESNTALARGCGLTMRLTDKYQISCTGADLPQPTGPE